MKNPKVLLYVGAVFIYSYLCVKMSGNTDLINLYNGIPFDSKIFFTLMQFFLFACYSLFIYNEFEEYLYEYGAYVILREQSRLKIYLRLVKQLISHIFFIETIKVISFIGFMYLIKGKITIGNPLNLIRSIILFLIVYCFILFIQMILEVFLTGRISLIIVMGYTLFSLGLSSIVQGEMPKINLFILLNYSMEVRTSGMIQEFNISHNVIIMILILIIIMISYVSWRIFNKRDFLPV